LGSYSKLVEKAAQRVAGDVQRSRRDGCGETDVPRRLSRQALRLPASGFYEWTGAKGDKQPHIFVDAQGQPILALAGLWKRWRDPATGDDVLSCTLIVTEPTQWMLPYHDRMPVLLQQAEIDRWLSGKMEASELHAADEGALREWPIDRRINKADAGDDDPMTLEPIESGLL
jgi:putative SOS response-associated peptidase YedK